jgi:hypothetical protein
MSSHHAPLLSSSSTNADIRAALADRLRAPGISKDLKVFLRASLAKDLVGATAPAPLAAVSSSASTAALADAVVAEHLGRRGASFSLSVLAAESPASVSHAAAAAAARVASRAESLCGSAAGTAEAGAGARATVTQHSALTALLCALDAAEAERPLRSSAVADAASAAPPSTALLSSTRGVDGMEGRRAAAAADAHDDGASHGVSTLAAVAARAASSATVAESAAGRAALDRALAAADAAAAEAAHDAARRAAVEREAVIHAGAAELAAARAERDAALQRAAAADADVAAGRKAAALDARCVAPSSRRGPESTGWCAQFSHFFQRKLTPPPFSPPHFFAPSLRTRSSQVCRPVLIRSRGRA